MAVSSVARILNGIGTMIEYEEPMYPVFDHIWGMVNDGEIGRAAAHRMLGRYFGYPECCIEAFVDSALNQEDSGCIGDDRFYCWNCLPLEGVAE